MSIIRLTGFFDQSRKKKKKKLTYRVSLRKLKIKKNNLQGDSNLKDGQEFNQNFKNVENILDLDLLRKRLRD